MWKDKRRWAAGDSVVEALAKDLQKAFPGTSGFSARNLWDMRRFYSTYSDAQFLQQAVAELGELKGSKKLPQPVAGIGTVAAQPGPPEFLRQAVAEIPWGHHLQILNKVETPAARLYYLRATAKLGWSRNVLLNQGEGLRALADAQFPGCTAGISRRNKRKRRAAPGGRGLGVVWPGMVCSVDELRITQEKLSAMNVHSVGALTR
ncbi:MAG: DUF1016 N-terminal domain-containing protein [Candidatus Binatia bacterium]